MAWASGYTGNGIIMGLSMSAKADCPRKDVVYLLWKQYGQEWSEQAKASSSSGFTDLKVGDPHYDAIMALVKNDIIAGYADGRFGADDPITDSEAGRILERLKGNSRMKPASEMTPKETSSPRTRGDQMGTMSNKWFTSKTNLTIDQIPAEDAAKLRAYATEHPAMAVGGTKEEGIKYMLDRLVRGYNTGYLSSIGGVGDMDEWLTRGELCQIFYDLGYTTRGSLK